MNYNSDSTDRGSKVYDLKVLGYTNSQIAEQIGVEAKRVPTILKAYLKRTRKPAPAGCACDLSQTYKTQAPAPAVVEEPKTEYGKAVGLEDTLKEMIAAGVSNKAIGAFVRGRLR